VIDRVSEVGRKIAHPGTLAPLEGEFTAKNESGRTGWYFVPERKPDVVVPILVGLHGTNGDGHEMITTFRELAAKRGFAIVSPSSNFVSEASAYTWRVGDKPNDFPDDYRHVKACLDELLSHSEVAFDTRRVLAVGFSGGASSAPFLATNTEPYTAFAVLHGGVFMGGLGARHVPGWFSTGSADSLRPPPHVQSQMDPMARAGFDVVYREFPGGHETSTEETTALVDWWLGTGATAAQR